MVEKIKALCSQNGMSLNDLEEKIDGIGINTIYRWDSSSPNAARLLAVAEYFGVSVDWLLGREASISDDENTLLAAYRRLSYENRVNLIKVAQSFAPADSPVIENPKIS